MRVKIPVSGFVMIAGRVSTCEQVAAFLQLLMCPLDPGRIKKPWKREKNKEWVKISDCRWSPEFKWNPCVGWEDFVMSRLSLHPELNPSCFCAPGCTKVLWGAVLALKSWKAKKTGLTCSKKKKKGARARGSQAVLLTSVLQMQNWGTER